MLKSKTTKTPGQKRPPSINKKPIKKEQKEDNNHGEFELVCRRNDFIL